MSEPKRMDPAEYERRLLRLVSEVLEGGISEEREREALALLGDDLWVTRELMPRLVSPPRLCGECGQPFRSVLADVETCFPCRDSARRAAERAAIEAEVRAQMAASGEF